MTRIRLHLTYCYTDPDGRPVSDCLAVSAPSDPTAQDALLRAVRAACDHATGRPRFIPSDLPGLPVRLLHVDLAEHAGGVAHDADAWHELVDVTEPATGSAVGLSLLEEVADAFTEASLLGWPSRHTDLSVLTGLPWARSISHA